MPDIITKKETESAAEFSRRHIKVGLEYMRHELATWHDANMAHSTLGYINDPDNLQIRLNDLIEVVEATAARDVAALLPTTPWIPFAAKNEKEWGDRARAKQKGLQNVLEQAGYLPEFTLCTQYAELYGNGGLEVVWECWIENIFDRIVETQPVPMPDGTVQDVIVNITEDSRKEMRDGLRFRAHPPWGLVWSPAGNSPLSKEALTIREVISRAEAERLIDEGVWKPVKMSATKLKESLKAGPSQTIGSEWANLYATDFRSFSDEVRKDSVMLCRTFTAGRWVTMLNYEFEVRDTENRFRNMDERVKPASWMTFNPHLGSSPHFGCGRYQQLRDLIAVTDDFASLIADAQMTANGRMWVYDPRYIDEEDLVSGGDVKIELRNAQELGERTIDRALTTIDPPVVQDATMSVFEILQGQKQSRVGLQDVLTGKVVTPKQTMGAHSQMNEAAQTRLGVRIRFVEWHFQPQVAYLTTKLCDMRMTPVQLMDDGGLTFDEMKLATTLGPHDLPGGYSWAFEGAERITRRQQRVENVKELFNFAGNVPWIAEGEGLGIIIEKMIEGTEAFDHDEKEKIMAPMRQNQGMPPPQAPPGAPGAPGAPQQRLETVGETGAVTNPNEMGSPAINQELEGQA